MRVRFYYDVICPYSYLESHAVEAAEDAGQIEVVWLPFELRPAPRPLLEPRGDVLRDGVAPPTVGLGERDPACDVRASPVAAPLVAGPRALALASALAFGGSNVVIALRRLA